jgi:hypothetical protein
MDWIDLAQDRGQALVNAVMNLWVPYIVGNFLTGCEPVSLSRRTLLCVLHPMVGEHMLTYVLTYLLHGAEFFLRS